SPDANPELRLVAFAFADRLGLEPCPPALYRQSAMPPDTVLPDFKSCLAIDHLSRNNCPGPWLESALAWFPVDPTLSPRIALREARRNPGASTDSALARVADSRSGNASALALWICGLSRQLRVTRGEARAANQP
ncbi:MAG: hypothetical protein ABR587_17385, partial [Candidatus Binatia bacterium]